MISPNTVQEGIVTRLKGKASVIELLSSASDVKEDQWQGTTFSYPAIRVRLDNVNPILDCNTTEVLGAILVFSEDASSKEANNIAYAVMSELDKSFTSAGYRYVSNVRGIIPAIRQDDRTWRSEVLFRMMIETGN